MSWKRALCDNLKKDGRRIETIEPRDTARTRNLTGATTPARVGLACSDEMRRSWSGQVRPQLVGYLVGRRTTKHQEELGLVGWPGGSPLQPRISSSSWILWVGRRSEKGFLKGKHSEHWATVIKRTCLLMRGFSCRLRAILLHPRSALRKRDPRGEFPHGDSYLFRG